MTICKNKLSSFPLFSGCANNNIVIPILYNDGTQYRNYNLTFQDLLCGIPFSAETSIESFVRSGETLIRNQINGVDFTVDLSSLRFTGNTSATCISDLYVHNLGGCSPINVLTDVNFGGALITNISSDSGLTENSDSYLATQKAVKSYIDNSKPYKVYTALLSQNDPIPTQTSGTFTVGQIWYMTTYAAGDDFSNMELISGTTQNETGSLIRATVDTPTNWANGSDLSYDGAPYVVSTNPNGDIAPFENTLGNVIWNYIGLGQYSGTVAGMTGSKTFPVIYQNSANMFDISYFAGDVFIETRTQDLFSKMFVNGDNFLYYTPVEIKVYN